MNKKYRFLALLGLFIFGCGEDSSVNSTGAVALSSSSLAGAPSSNSGISFPEDPVVSETTFEECKEEGDVKYWGGEISYPCGLNPETNLEALVGSIWFSRDGCIKFERNGVWTLDSKPQGGFLTGDEVREDFISKGTFSTLYDSEGNQIKTTEGYTAIVMNDFGTGSFTQSPILEYDEQEGLVSTYPAYSTELSGEMNEHYCIFLEPSCWNDDLGNKACFASGELHGEYSKDGFSGTYTNGVRTGIWTQTLSSGYAKLSYDGTNDNYTKEVYDDEGTLKEESVWEAGELVSKKEWKVMFDGSQSIVESVVDQNGYVQIVKEQRFLVGGCLGYEKTLDISTMIETVISYNFGPPSCQTGNCNDPQGYRYLSTQWQESGSGDRLEDYCADNDGNVVDCPVAVCN